MTDTNFTQLNNQLGSPNSSGLNLNLNNIESGYLSGGANSHINEMMKDKNTPKYSSSIHLDHTVDQANQLMLPSGKETSKKQQSSMMKHRMAVQNSIKNASTPMSGRNRIKRVSAYEASDDESVLEFQNVENQLLNTKEANTRKSNMHLQSQQQDAAHPVVSQSGQSTSKFKKNTTKNQESKKLTKNTNTNSGFGSKMSLQQQQSKNNTNVDSSKNSGKVSRKQSNINQKQNQTKPIATQDNQQVQANDTNSKNEKANATTTRGGCCGIFCCGYCCSKGAGLSDKDKTQEMDLRPEQKPLPDIQELKSPTAQQKANANFYYGANDQDLSQIDDQEENDYNSISHSQIDDNDIHVGRNNNQNDEHRISDSYNSQVIEEEMDDMEQMDIDELGDEEKVELDLRSDIRNPNSGQESAGGMQRSLKSSTDPVEFRPSHDPHQSALVNNRDDVIDEEVNDDNSQANNTNIDLSDGVDDNSYDMDRKKLEQNLINRNSQPRLIQDDDDEQQVMSQSQTNYYSNQIDSNDMNRHLQQQQYSSVPDPERRYSNEQFMRIEGPSPESQMLLLPMGNVKSHSQSQTPSVDGINDADVSDFNSQKSQNNNDYKAKSTDNAAQNRQATGGHQRIIGDQMDDEIIDDVQHSHRLEHDEHDSLRELDDQSDKTIDNDQDQYKLAQAKRMYVIHEVDEDAFSERSSRINKSKLLTNTYEKPHSMYNDQNSGHNEYQNSQHGLKEQQPNDQNIDANVNNNVYDEEDVYGLNSNVKHQQTLSMDNDLSSMQINASQDIEPHNISQTNLHQQQRPSQTSSHNLQNSNQIINQKSPDGGVDSVYSDNLQNSGSNRQNMQSAKSFNGGEKQQQSNNMVVIEDFQTYDKHSKSLINFQKYMEDEEAKQSHNIHPSQTPKEKSSKQNQISNSVSPINSITPTNLDKTEKQTGFFRPQKSSSANKGAGQQLRPSNESINQIHEEIVLIDDFTSSNPKQQQNSQQKQSAITKVNDKKSQLQQSNTMPFQKVKEYQPQVVIQKLAIDKSKLSQTYYSNFDQFIIANNLNIDDQTKKASIQTNFKESANPFNTENTNEGKLDTLSDTKELAIKKYQERKSIQDQQKHQQAQQVKQKAMKKDKDRIAKQLCAIKIQKLWKGHSQRQEYVSLRDNLRKVKGVRRLFEISHQKFKFELLSGIIHAIKHAKANKDEEEQKMLNSFLNVCAIQIQSNWRGSKYRKSELPQLKKSRRAEEIIKAFVKGWKMRKVIQTRETFTMGQHIKDLTKVQEYFLYVEKSDNMMLLGQLKKDRRKAIQGYIDLVDHLYTTGQWIKGYIGNKIIENEDQLDSTMDGLDSLKSPIKDYNMDESGQMRELITTEKFLYDEDLEKNPYIFESDEFVRQKFMERRQREYQGVDIEFVDQKKDSGKQLSQQHKNRNKLKAVDDDSSRFDDSESAQLHSEGKKKLQTKTGNGKFRDSSFDSDLRGSINPKDNLVIPKNKKTFEQMLEDAMTNEKGGISKKGNTKNSNSKEFLKRKEKYDPQKSLKSKKGEINNKNVEKKRIFKSKNKMGSENSDESDQDQDNNSMLDQDGEVYSQESHRGTFKHFPRKSFIQLESEPLMTNKTVLPPSLMQKLYIEQIKVQKYLRTDTGRQIGANANKFEVLNKNQQIYPSMPIPEQKQQMLLNLAELENIYNVYHGSDSQQANSFLKSKDIKRDKDSKLPVLKEKALFYKYYDDKVYESVLDDMKKEHAKSVKVHKKWMFGAQKLY